MALGMFFSGWDITPPTKLTWSHPSYAHRPEYKANDHDDGLVLVPSNKGFRREEDAFPRARCTIPKTKMKIWNRWVLAGCKDRSTRTRTAILLYHMSTISHNRSDTKPTFTVVNTTAAREPSLRPAMQMIVTSTTAPIAVSLMAHWGISSGDTSALQKMRFRYSAKMRVIIAFEPIYRTLVEDE